MSRKMIIVSYLVIISLSIMIGLQIIKGPKVVNDYTYEDINLHITPENNDFYMYFALSEATDVDIESSEVRKKYNEILIQKDKYRRTKALDLAHKNQKKYYAGVNL